MANGQSVFNRDDLEEVIYQALLSHGVNAGDAAQIAQDAVKDSSTGTAAVERILEAAWAMTPDSLPVSQRAKYAQAIVTAWRGNSAQWNALIDNDPAFKDLFKGKSPAPASNPENIDLAFAEHYLRERYQVGTTGDAEFAKSWIAAYNSGKRIAFDLGVSWAFKRTAHNPSPPVLAELWWGLAGVLRGQKDYQQQNPGKAPNSFGVLYQELPLPWILKNLSGQWNWLWKDVLHSFSSQPAGSAVMQCNVSPVPVQNIGVEIVPGPTTGA
jgi:hypothetical protein